VDADAGNESVADKRRDENPRNAAYVSIVIGSATTPRAA